MFSPLRKRIRVSPATVLASVAIVLAMTGGAYAAGRYVITSTKQIKPSVLKALKGNAGAPGRSGAPGAAGATGAAGPAGPQGAEGKQGPEGKAGANGAPGEKGAKGETGSPWTAGGTLPKGSTETGTWSVATHESVGFAAISFAIPLPSALGETHVHYVSLEEVAKKTAPAQCPGSSGAPTATEGNLCVYEGEFSNPNNGVAEEGAHINDTHTSEPGAAVAGAALTLVSKEAEASLWGSWAVTG